ncbi:MAG: tetratricopeptide repeat protein [Desulfomonile tiedjei]|uniref:Tetratricopeptide repeat protein n=1 Tax=Desulfomonile tiedjei TaxID=2358 RepID=A0A9D6V2J4_9BACT|nr:tetratricopeptide repeat protein [Desulfomonile tiedjei]
MPRLLRSNVCRYCLLFFVFFIVALAVHYGGFNSPMIYDSKVWISDKAYIFAEGDLGQIISIFPERPLFMLVLYMNYLFFGMDPYFFRLIASGFSAAAGLVLVLLAYKVFHLPVMGTGITDTNKACVSVFLGLLFVVHPLQTFAVLYIWQSQVVLACFFYFSALAAYLTAAGSESGQRKRWYLICAILFFFGLSSKEIIASLPISMVLAELVLFGRDWKQTIKRALVVGAITIPCLGIYLVLAYCFHGEQSVITKGVVARIAEYYGEGGWPPLQVALTECRVFLMYLASVVAPFVVDLRLVKAMLVSGSLLEPPSTMWAVAGTLGWLASGLWLIRRDPIISFGMLFFVVALLPESALIPQYLYFGYRPILPMAGILLIVGRVLLSAITWGELKLPKRILQGGVAAAFIFPVAVLAWLSHTEATEWRPLKVWEKAYQGSPKWSENVEKRLYTNILVNYGAELVNAGENPDAVNVLSLAIQVAPKSPSVHNNLANALLGMGKVSEAIDVYEKAIQLNVATPEIFSNLGVALLKSDRIHEAKDSFAKAVQINPGFAKAWANLGMICLRLGQIPEAINHLTEAVRINPRLALAQKILGQALELGGDFPQAADRYAEALRLSPGLVDAHFRLGNVMVKLNDAPKATEHYRSTLRLDPKHYAAENNLGSALMGMSEFSEAAKHFRRAVEIRPDFDEARTNLEAALLRLKNEGK